MARLISSHLIRVLFVTAVLAVPLRAATRDVLAAASSRAVVVAQVETIKSKIDNTEATTSTVYRRTLGGDGRFLKLITLSGRITALGCESDQAVALLETGQWMTIWAGDNSLGPAIPRARLVTLIGSSTGVWAIANQPPPASAPSTAEGSTPSAPGSPASSVPALTTAASTAPAATEPASTSPSSSPSESSPDRGGLAVFHFDRTNWVKVCPLPDAITTVAADDLSFSVNGSVITLAVGGFDGIKTWTRDANSWIAGPVIRPGHLANEFRILECGSPPMIWSSDDEQWLARSGDLKQLAPDGASAISPKSAACVAEAVRVFSLDEGNVIALPGDKSGPKELGSKLAEQAYTLDGKPIGKRADLVIDATGSSNDAEGWISTGLTIIVTLLLVSSAWRRPATASAALEKLQPLLAPPGVRLLAGAIDLIPVGIALAVQAAEMNGETGFTTRPTFAEMLPFWIGIAVYLLHTTIGEIVSGRTAGKYLTGLRVVTLDGSRLGVPAVIVRNLLRLIDVMLMWIPLALILVSPLRQRLGDVAARTVVIRESLRDPLAVEADAEAS